MRNSVILKLHKIIPDFPRSTKQEVLASLFILTLAISLEIADTVESNIFFFSTCFVNSCLLLCGGHTKFFSGHFMTQSISIASAVSFFIFFQLQIHCYVVVLL